MEKGSTDNAPVREHRDGDWRVWEKDDGTGYYDLYQRFLRGQVEAVQFRNAATVRDVYLLTDKGKRYILKRDYTGWGFGGERGFERFFWKFTRGPFYSRLMRRVDKARRNGCDRCQAMYMVAERRTWWYVYESVALYEFIEGDTLEKLGDVTPLLPEITACLASLHQNDLALCDVNPRNFVKTSDGIKVIDMVSRGNARIDRIKDTIRAEKVFGILEPVHGIDRLIRSVLQKFQKLRTRWVEYKLTKRKLHRDALFRSSEKPK